MFKSLRYELSVMVHKKEFLFAFCAMMAFALASFIASGGVLQNGFGVFDRSEVMSPSNAFIGSDYAPLRGYLTYIFAFLVVLPFSMSYINDYETGILPAVLTRCSKRGYIRSKILTCFIGNVLIIALPLLFSYLLCSLAYPVRGNVQFGSLGMTNYFRLILGTSVGINTMFRAMPFYRVLLFSPALYALLYTLIFSAASGIFGVFLLCVSFLIKRFRVVLFLPVYLIIMTGNVLDVYMYNASLYENAEYVNCQLMSYLVAYPFYGVSPYVAAGTVIVLGLISFICVKLGSRGDRLVMGEVKFSGKNGKKQPA